MIKKSGSTYKVYTKDGKRVLGSHPTKAAAQKQLAAIEISKAKRAKKVSKHPSNAKKKKAAEGGPAVGIA